MSGRTSNGTVPDLIEFFSMARNLKDGPSFYVWLAKLWDFDAPLTIKYVRANVGRFDDVSIDAFNKHLVLRGKGRFLL
jgi:hypothetical protein